MDLLVCGAPLDNSFQKDKLELVNKGSLGRRRKPSRANLKQLLSPSNRFSLQTSSNESDSEDGGYTSKKICVANRVTENNFVRTAHIPFEESTVFENNIVENQYPNHVSESTHEVNGWPKNSLADDLSSKRPVEDKLVEKRLETKQNGERKSKSKYSAEREALALHIAQKASLISRALGKSSTTNPISRKTLPTNQILQNTSPTNHISEKTIVNNHISEKFSTAKKATEKVRLVKNVQQKTILNGDIQEKTVHSFNSVNSIKLPERNGISVHKSVVPNGVCAKDFSLNRCSTTTHQDLSRTPTPSSTNYVKPNENGYIQRENEYLKAKTRIECGSLPRHQRCNKQGAAGVLIQTWERRSRSDSLRRNNRPNAMPEPRVRDSYSDDTVLNRITENGTRYNKPVQMKGKQTKTKVPEPEWISLSRKLCAKYVEGNTDPNSPDSETHEEPHEAPNSQVLQPNRHPHHQPTRHPQPHPPADPHPEKRQPPPLQRAEEAPHHQPTRHLHPPVDPHPQKRQAPPLLKAEEKVMGNGEPPWIHLSRKLCTKFIEEHIEFPVIVKEECKKETVEPNGDVRIIEKIGPRSKGKMNGRKESEPEWVSLSKKLRAKFIESHLDDPDTISLENQLNASDPEETSSDSLPDSSVERVQPRRIPDPQSKRMHIKSHEEGTAKPPAHSTPHPNRFQPAIQNTLLFPEEECCWEYQEMEFDQESNPDTFQEADFCEEPAHAQKSVKTDSEMFSIDSLEAFNNNNNGPSRNPNFISNVECYNNDVSFAPQTEPLEVRKEITVQFRSHKKAQVPKCDDRKNDSFFNLTTWKEAHHESDREPSPTTRSNLRKELRSKSMSNVRDTAEDDAKAQSVHSERSISKSTKSEEFLDKVDVTSQDGMKSSFIQNTSPNLSRTSNSISNSSDVSTQSVEEDLSRSKCKENIRSGCSKTSQTDLHLLCNDFNGHFEAEMNVLGSLKPKTVRPECCKTSQTDLNLICCEHLSSDDSVSFLNGDAVKRGNKMKKMKDKETAEKRNRKSSSSSSGSSFNRSNKYNGDVNHGDDSEIVRSKSLKEQCQETRNIKEIHCSKKDQFQSERTEKTINGNSNHSVQSGTTNREHSSTSNQINNGLSGMKKHFKCNGSLPNGSNFKSPVNTENSRKKDIIATQSKKSVKSSIETNGTKQGSPVINEYANIQSTMAMKEHINSVGETGMKFKSNSIYQDKHEESSDHSGMKTKSKTTSQSTANLNNAHSEPRELHIQNGGASLAKIKSKSLHDLATRDRGTSDDDDDGSSMKKRGEFPPVKFQEFEFPSEIPLCAKLVSKQKKASTSSTSSSYKRDASPGSESHVYEDMFKETTNSDSEASSWTAMKKNSYYVNSNNNNRSSSMNDLDCSDSCSMSVKCDYASSGGSGRSTLRSSSPTFYVNLRDYDQHMLEPGKKKKTAVAKVNSNPPTPESLRHLFTSPLTPSNRLVGGRQEAAESHYYSTASSAFKRGFDPAPVPKPKKTERSSSIKIKDIAHGIILTFRRFQNHSKSVSPTHYVDVSHLAESRSKDKKKDDKGKWAFPVENGRTDSDSGCPPSDTRNSSKPRRSSSDLSPRKSNGDASEKKKSKNGKKSSNNRDKGKKSRSSEPVPTVSRKVQQMADGTLYLVTTVSGDTTLPGVYSDSSSELSTHAPVKPTGGESNC